MSTNFNLAMLRNLHEPVSESLDAAIMQLSQYAAGTMDPSSFSGAHHAHLVNGSLSVIGCRAASRVAALLEEAMGALPMPQTRGWSDEQALEVARLCQDLSSQLLEHINRILADMEDLPVRMWPTYRDLHEHLGSPVQAAPEDLYEPDPNFQNLKFAPLAEDYLSSVIRGAISRLRDAIEKVDGSSSKQDLETGLQSALKVFDWVYSLRHARGYQAYWLALSARISMGLLDDDVLGDKGPWSVLLGEALIELEKFARNNRRVDPDLLGKTIRPLVSRWPAHWAQSHPTMAETNERLGISLFWETLDEVESTSKPQVLHASNELPSIIEQLKLSWGRYVVAEGASPDQALAAALENFRKSYPPSIMEQAAVASLMNSVAGSLEQLPPAGEVSDAVALEFAAAVLLLEDALDGRGRQASVSDSQSSLQRRRLHASLTGAPDQLAALPRLRWDDKKHERQLRAASSAAFAQVQKDIAEIEESLVERLRDDHVSLDMAAISRRANQAGQVLEMLDAKPAATIATSLVDLVDRVDRNPGKDPGQAVTLGIAALDTFLSARQAGDGEATHLLAEAYQAVTGEPMPYGYATDVDTDEVKRAAQDLISRSTKGEQADDDVDLDPVPAATVQEKEHEEPASAPAQPQAQPPRFDPSCLGAGCKVSRAGHPMEGFFLEEMDHVLAEIAMQRGALASDPSDTEARQTLRRQFHTIKGSSRIAGFDAIGHAAERVENYLDRALVSRQNHGQMDDALVSRAVIDMKDWFASLSGNEDAWVSSEQIDAWFDGVDEPEPAAEADELEHVDQPETQATAHDLPSLPTDAPAVDDVELVAIAGYGSMEYEAYYCMTEDLQKSLGLLDDLASASQDDAIAMEALEGSLRGVMDIGESIGAPALARLPRAMLENAQASISRSGLSSARVFATPVLSAAARGLGAVIRDLSEQRKMGGVDTDLLHDLQANTDFLRAGALASVDAVPANSDHAPQTTQPADSGLADRSRDDEDHGQHDVQAPALVPDFMDELAQGIDDPAPGADIVPDAEASEQGQDDEAAQATADHEPAAEPDSSADGNQNILDHASQPPSSVEFPIVPDNIDEEAEAEPAAPDMGLAHVDDGYGVIPADQSQDAHGITDHASEQAPSAPIAADATDAKDEEEEDALWDEVFDNFEQISACLRKIGPLLVSLSERRK